jgi:hypothetical protein
MDESTKTTIEKYQAKMELLEAQVRKIKISINSLCELENEPPIYDVGDETSGPFAKPQAIRSDQYFGRPIATVVKEILTARFERQLGAISLDDLFSLMLQGGFDFEGKDESSKKRSLAITVGKNPAFIRVPSSNHIGLSEWYPGAKRSRRNGDEDELPIGKDAEATTPNAEPGLPPGVPKEYSTEGMPE